MADMAEKFKKKKKNRTRFYVILLILTFFLCGIYLAKKYLPPIAVSQLAEMTNTQINVGSIDFDLNGSVHLQDLTIRPDINRPDYDDSVMRAEILDAKFDNFSLLFLKPRLNYVKIKNFIFDAKYDFDKEHWNLTDIDIKLPDGKSEATIPKVELENGLMRYVKIKNGRQTIAAQLPLEVNFDLEDLNRRSYIFEVKTAPVESGSKSLKGKWSQGHLSFAGSLSSQNIPAYEMAWVMNSISADLTYDSDLNYRLKLRIKDLVNKYCELKEADVPSLLRSIEPLRALENIFKRYNPVGKVDVELSASGNIENLKDSELEGKVFLKDMAVIKHDFPYQIDDMNGLIVLDSDKVTLKGLKGMHGDSEIFIEGWCKGFDKNYLCDIHIKSPNMELEDDLFSALKEKQQRLWRLYKPEGITGLDYHYIRKPNDKKKQVLKLKPENVDAVFGKFPYPLKNVNGEIKFEGDDVYLNNVISRYSDRKIKIDGKVTKRNENKNEFKLQITGDNIPLDDTLYKILPPEYSFLKKMNIKGKTDAVLNVFTDAATAKADYSAKVTFKDARIKKLMGKYDLKSINGKAIIDQKGIELKNIKCQSNGVKLNIKGRISANQNRYDILLSSDETRLDQTVISSLPDKYKRAVSKFRPEGNIGFKLRIKKTAEKKQPEFELAMQCKGTDIYLPDQKMSLRNARGKISFADNILIVKDVVTSLPGDLNSTEQGKVSISGQIFLKEETISKAVFVLDGKKIQFNERILNKISSESLSKLLKTLSPEGAIDIDDMEVTISKKDADTKGISLKGNIEINNCCLRTRPKISDINLDIDLSTAFDPNQGIKSAVLRIAKGMFKLNGKSVTDIETVLKYNPEQRSWSSNGITGRCHSGRLTGNVTLYTDKIDNFKYRLESAFQGIDLRAFLAESANSIPENGYSKGNMQGSINLFGQTADSNSLKGRCRVRIKDMTVARTSPLTKILDVVQLNEPSDFIYEQMFIEGWFKDDDLYFEKIDISGQNAAFHGTGKMSIDNLTLDLVLAARGKRVATSEPGVFQSLTDIMRESVVKVKVTGLIDDPVIETEPLPVLNDSLKILGQQK